MSPSRREHGVRKLAQCACWAGAAALLAATLADGAWAPAAPAAVMLALIAGVAAGRARPAPAVEIGVDPGGRLVMRHSGGEGGATEHRLQCPFAAPWLITLKDGTMWVRIWPDSLPGNAFRRFWVHIRWSPGRQPADRTVPVRSP